MMMTLKVLQYNLRGVNKLLGVEHHAKIFRSKANDHKPFAESEKLAIKACKLQSTEGGIPRSTSWIMS